MIKTCLERHKINPFYLFPLVI